MNLWEQYNPGQPLGSTLSALTGQPLSACSDKALFDVLKRHLTRREMRCFVMDSSGASTASIVEKTGFTPEEVEAALQKGRKKLRQPKLQEALRSLLMDEDSETE